MHLQSLDTLDLWYAQALAGLQCRGRQIERAVDHEADTELETKKPSGPIKPKRYRSSQFRPVHEEPDGFVKW